LRIWKTIIIDFNELLADKYGYDSVFVIIDVLSKGLWTVPCKKITTVKDAVLMYYEGLYWVYGLFDNVISD